MPTSQKDLDIADDIIARTIDLYRFDAAERRRILEILKRMEEELLDSLLRDQLTETARRDKSALLAQAQQIIARYYGEAADEFARTMPDLAQIEAGATAASLGDAFTAGIRPQLPDETFFRTLAADTLIMGAPSADWWKRQAGDVMFRFANEVRQGLSSAETNAKIIRRVRDVMEVSRRNAAFLVQTSVQTVANRSRFETFKANGDLVKGVRQISTLDGKTSLVCVSYSGAAWDLEGKPIEGNKLAFNGGPPRHFNCRSVLVPITKTFRELGLDVDEPPVGTRASMDGQIAGNTSFEQFIDRKGRGFADELLGVERSKLYREGKLTLQQFLDQSGRPMTLDELRDKYGV